MGFKDPDRERERQRKKAAKYREEKRKRDPKGYNDTQAAYMRDFRARQRRTITRGKVHLGNIFSSEKNTEDDVDPSCL